MCALRAHIKLSIFRNIFSKIEKVVITFSIIEKIFPNIESLICAGHTLTGPKKTFFFFFFSLFYRFFSSPKILSASLLSPSSTSPVLHLTADLSSLPTHSVQTQNQTPQPKTHYLRLMREID